MARHGTMIGGPKLSGLVFGGSDSTDGGVTLSTNVATSPAINIGTAQANRDVVVGIAAYRTAGNTVSGVTIGGLTASLIDSFNNGNYILELWHVTIASGTTAAVVVTFASAPLTVSVGLWSVYGKSVSTHNSAAASSTTIDIPANGCVIASAYTDGFTVTMTGVTKDFDISGGTGTNSHAGGSRNVTTAETGTTISNSDVSSYIQVASFG